MSLKSNALIKQASARFQKKHASRLDAARRLAEAGRLGEAGMIYQGLLEAFPKEPFLLTECGTLFVRANAAEEGLKLLNHSLAILTAQPRAWCMKGVALTVLFQFDEALACFNRSLELEPRNTPALLNRGRLRRAMGETLSAVEDYQKSIQLDPRIPEAHYNLGNALRDQGLLEQALKAYESALSIKPDFAKCKIARGLIRLSKGEWLEGLRDYEARWSLPFGSNTRTPGERTLKPNDAIEGRTVLIYAEQGLGDTLQFCRYAKYLSDRGAEVTLAVQKPLTRLIDSLDARIKVTSLEDVVGKGFDFECAMLDLLTVLEARSDDIPFQENYLMPREASLSTWMKKLGENQGFRVGLVWAGGDRSLASHEHLFVNQRRNIPLQLLLQMLPPDISTYSLQKGDKAEAELRALPHDPHAAPPPIDLAPALSDFEETAAAISCLDLVLAVDTSVAHLAGALGKPVFILNRFDSDWRWFPEGEGCPWYASGKVFRQKKMGDWESLIEPVREALRLAQQKRAR